MINKSKKKLKFDEKKHVYKLGRKKLTSVTTFVKQFFDHFDDKAIAKYVAASRQRKGEVIDDKAVLKEWADIANEGTIVHKDIQLFLDSGIIPVHHKANMAIDWMDTKGIMAKLKHSELQVFSEDLGLAGTIDLVVHESARTKEISIIDWKTNKQIKTTSPKRSSHPATKGLMDCHLVRYSLQLSLYAYILEKEYGFTIKELTLAHLHPDGVLAYTVPYEKEIVMRMIDYGKENTRLDR